MSASSSSTIPKTKPTYIQTKGSNVESRESGGTSDVLPAERAKRTFDVEKLTNVLDGGPDKTKRRRFIISPGKDTDLSDKYFWDRRESLKQHVKHFIGVHEDFWNSFIPTREDVAWMMENSMMSGALMNHYGLFLPTLIAQCNQEQKLWWAFPAWQMKIVGCYAQTELGHGSNVRGLMTTAEYDKNSQQFILNTPTLRSIKWWPGAMGKVGTHAVVYAQLIIDGKEYGVHAFMLQIRDENHKPLPGIEVGDLGPKLGDAANDTGYMRLDNVRIPREYMLAQHQQVTPAGEYVKGEKKEKNDKTQYATMMFTRGTMVKGASGYLARAVTIATRYSCVRVQGFVDTTRGKSFKAEERKVIDYQVQRFRIFKQVALAYALKFTGKWMLNSFKELEGSEKSSMDMANIEALPFFAATSAGLKALSTYLAWAGIEDCRKCCGGNGYLLSSGIASMAADYVWQTTAEGDWVILMLQTARFLLKTLRDAQQGNPVSGPVAYMAATKEKNFSLAKVAPPKAKSSKDFWNLPYLVALFRYRALFCVLSAAEQFGAKISADESNFDEAWNESAIELLSAVRGHCHAFMLDNFVLAVETEAQDPAVKAVLAKVCALYATSNIIDDPSWTGVISGDQLKFAKAAVVELMEAIRPDAVSLVDAFDIPDRVLNSVIGRSDGNVYEALYEAAKKSQLNEYDPFDGYEEYLRPHLDINFLKQGNIVPKL